MNALRLYYLAAALALALSACSSPDDLTSIPTLGPQFGTKGFDAVEDIAYGKAGMLYAVGTWNSTSVIQNFQP